MNNDALVAALGMDAVAAVHGYRKRVVAEARLHGLRLVSDPLSTIVRDSGRALVVDPIDIRLVFRHCPGRPRLAGRVLRWGPAHGWSMAHHTAGAAAAYLAGPAATPMRLVPTAPEVVLWAGGPGEGPTAAPVGVELDDDPGAIRRLLGFIDATDPHRVHTAAYLPPTRRPDAVERRTG